jgi:hypothetical protein
VSNFGKTKRSLSFYFLNKKEAKILETIGTYTENTGSDKTGFFEGRVGLSNHGITEIISLD